MRNFTQEQIEKAIAGSLGIMSTIAKRLGTDSHTAKKYVERYAATRQALADETEFTYDLAESRLLKAIEKGEAWAIKFYLTMKGQSRGYISQPIIKLDNSDPLNINFSGVSKASLLNDDTVEINNGEDTE